MAIPVPLNLRPLASDVCPNYYVMDRPGRWLVHEHDLCRMFDAWRERVSPYKIRIPVRGVMPNAPTSVRFLPTNVVMVWFRRWDRVRRHYPSCQDIEMSR